MSKDDAKKTPDALPDTFLSKDMAVKRGCEAADLVDSIGAAQAVCSENRALNKNMARSVAAGVMAAMNSIEDARSEGKIDSDSRQQYRS